MFRVVGLRLSSSLVPYDTHYVLICFASLCAGSMPCSTGFTVILPEIPQAVYLLKSTKSWYLSVWKFAHAELFSSWDQIPEEKSYLALTGHFELIDVWLHHLFVPCYYFWVFSKVPPAAWSAYLSFHWGDPSPIHTAHSTLQSRLCATPAISNRRM